MLDDIAQLVTGDPRQQRLWGERERASADVAVQHASEICATIGLDQARRRLFFQMAAIPPSLQAHGPVRVIMYLDRREFILGFACYSNKHSLQPARLEVGPAPATITTAIAPTAYSMPSMPPSGQPLSISLDFFDMDDMNMEQRTPLSSASSSSSEVSKTSPTRKIKKRNSTKVLSTKRLSNEEKQAKNRLFVKRCYYKKREALKNLREEVAQLESEFETVLQRWQQHNEHSAEAFRDGRRRILPHDLYAELTVVRSSLVEEQQRLNLRLADRHLFRQRLQQLYEPTR